MNLKTSFTTVFLLLCTLVCWAQQTQELRVRRISVVDGLKSNSIYCIQQDRRGFVWIGTENGLSRYDGYRFVNFTQLSPNKKQATDKRVGQIVFSKDGSHLRAITSTRDTAVYSLRLNRFEAYHRYVAKKHRHPAPPVVEEKINGYRFLSDSKGGFAIVSPSGDKKDYHLTDYVVKNRAHYVFVTQGKDGLFYIAVYGAGLYVYHPKTQVLERASGLSEQLNSKLLTTIMCDHQGNIWVGSENAGVYTIRSKAQVKAWYVYPEPHNEEAMANTIRCIYPLSGSRFLVCARSGRNYYYDLTTNQFTFAFNQGAGIYSYMLDKKGKTWIGTQNERVFDIVEDQAGRIWKATFGKGVIVADNISGQLKNTKSYLTEGLDVSCVRDLELSSDGRLWISTNAGLYSVDTHEKQIDKASFRKETIADVLSDDEVDFVHVSPKGNIWISVLGKGLLKAAYRNHRLECLQTIDTGKGLPVNNVRSVRELPSGDLWVSLEEGVCFVSANGVFVTPYSFSGNAESNAFSENTSGIAGDGSVLFGSSNGLLVIKGGTVPRMDNSAKVLVTDLLVNGSSLFLDGGQITDHVRLPHHRNSIVFNYTDLNYSHISSRLYEYYLEGVDDGWREATSQNMAVYNNLKPGTYVFHIKKQGLADAKATTMTITILEPWYNTWWAWLLYLIVIGVTGGIFFRNGRERFRLKQQIEMDKQLMDFRINFFTHIAHEFRTPIAIIQTAVGRIKASRDHRVSAQVLASTLRGTERLSRLINQLMDFRRINTGNLQLHVADGNIVSFVQRIYQDFWDMAKRKDQNFVFIPFSKEHNMLFDAKVLESIIYNLVSNAVKYTPMGGNIEVKVKLEKDKKLAIAVENNGSAISEQQLNHLFEPFMHGYVSQGGMGIGLYMAHRMAELHHGSLTYERKDGLSVFTVLLPLDRTVYSSEECLPHNQKTEDVAEEDNAREEVREMLPQPLNNYRVAIVEDDIDMMEQVKTEVGQYFHVKGYMDGLSAVEGIVNSKPDVILCDVMLPGIDGYEVVKRVRSHAELRNTPIIMLTSMDDDSHQIKAYQVGADDYMIKPCSYKVLVTRMAQLIKWKSASVVVEDSNVGQNPTKADGEKPKNTNSTAKENQMSEKTPEEAKVLLSIEDKHFMERVDALIANHLSDFDFNLTMIADQLSVGRTTFFGRVKKITGMSPNKYILKFKMEKARQLLVETDLSVSEVSYKIGVEDSSYFNRLFKNSYGMSPSQFRKQKIEE